MFPAAEGTLFTVTARLLAVPFPQEFTGVTVTLPEVAPNVTVMEFVFELDEVIEAPAGTVQL